MRAKRLTALVNGINKFVKSYGVYPENAIMDPDTLKQVQSEIEALPEGDKATRRTIKRTKLVESTTGVKYHITFAMNDNSV